MLIEFWERLRGYDKWIETEATVESSSEQKSVVQTRGGSVDVWSSNDLIVWTDASGEKQYAGFTAEENSPLFQLIDGNKVTIRYNPASSDEFYYRELLRDKVRKFVRNALVILAVAGYLIILTVWSRLQSKH